MYVIIMGTFSRTLTDMTGPILKKENLSVLVMFK